MEKNIRLEKKFVDASIAALKDLKKSYEKLDKIITDNPVINQALPFLKISIHNLGDVVDEYIKQYEEVKKQMKK